MQTALRVTTRVLPGHRLEIIAPELTDGEAVDVFVVLPRPAELNAPPATPQTRDQSQEKPELTEQQKGLAALLESWREEDATDDPGELAERDRELEEFKANMNRWRAEEGRPPAYE